MRYIGKLTFKKPMNMTKIAEMLKLEDAQVFKSEDMVGTINWEGVPILVLLHLSWGDINKVEKIRIYTHHLDDSEENDFWTLIIDTLGEVIKV